MNNALTKINRLLLLERNFLAIKHSANKSTSNVQSVDNKSQPANTEVRQESSSTTPTNGKLL